MRGFCALILLFLAAVPVLAESETQTDWAGGPGVAGPVTDWQNRFYIAGDMDWDTTPGQLKLIVDRSENEISTGSGPVYTVALDMEQDGDVDAAVCAYNSGNVYWCENADGIGTSWTKHVIGNVGQPRFIAVADFNGDGYRDIVASSGSEDRIVLFRYSPSGWSVGTDIATGFDARQIRAADINSDGMVDIVGVSDLSGDVCWWKNNGTNSSWDQNYIDGALMGAYVCDVGDFNNDGHPDVVAASHSEDDIAAYISQAPYGYSWHKDAIESSYSHPISVAVADYNNDGTEDFAVASSQGTGDLRWYDYLDTQSSWIYHPMTGALGSGIRDITGHDMDGDGYPEVMAACYNENRILWCKNREYLGENWETFSVSPYFSGAIGVSVGDVDGDNVPDVLGCSFTGDKTSWWRVSGFSTPSALTSSILDIEPPDPASAEWEYIYWSAEVPTGTGVRVRLKTSYNSSDMGPWSDWITAPGDLASLVAQGGSFLQYQVQLYTSNPNVTPSLKDITVLWNPVSIEDDDSVPVDGRIVWLLTGNPVRGTFAVGYNVTQTGYVDIAVYDAAGRTVSVINRSELAAGQYTEMVSDLPAGSYAVVMQCEHEVAVQKVVVVR